MGTAAANRRANLERLISELGSIEALAVRADSTAVYLSQVRNQAPDSKTGRPRSMGDQMARRLERACGKPAGWMDQGPAAGFGQPGLARETDAHYYQRPAEVVQSLARLLADVPRQDRSKLAAHLSALALAPDSAELVSDIAQLLHPSSGKKLGGALRRLKPLATPPKSLGDGGAYRWPRPRSSVCANDSSASPDGQAKPTFD